MQGIAKHIISCICVIFLTHLFVSNFHKEDMVFDPVDTEDNAVIQQGIAYLHFFEEPGKEHTKNTGFYSDQKTGKKAKDSKYVSFELFFNDGKHIIAMGIASHKRFIPAITEKYNYLFFKEINPPPPKIC